MSTTGKINSKKLLWAAPLTGVIAAAINAVLFFIGSSAGIINCAVIIPNANQPIMLLPVIMGSFIPTILAALVLAVLNAFLSNAWRVFTIVSAVLLLLSFSSPFMNIPGIPVGMGIWLNIMHVVVAGCVVYFFGRFAKD
jgi:hypothetical protein